jgi:hypothetical protein
MAKKLMSLTKKTIYVRILSTLEPRVLKKEDYEAGR